MMTIWYFLPWRCTVSILFLTLADCNRGTFSYVIIIMGWILNFDQNQQNYHHDVFIASANCGYYTMTLVTAETVSWCFIWRTTIHGTAGTDFPVARGFQDSTLESGRLAHTAHTLLQKPHTRGESAMQSQITLLAVLLKTERLNLAYSLQSYLEAAGSNTGGRFAVLWAFISTLPFQNHFCIVSTLPMLPLSHYYLASVAFV